MSEPIAADFGDRTDFVNSDRGFLSTIDPMVIKAADGRVVWDMDSWGFLDEACPDTANPSLWRHGIDMSGDPAVLGRLMSLIDDPNPDFAIVTP